MKRSKIQRRQFVLGCLTSAALASSLMTSFVHAEEQYPSKTVTLVVPFAPGGSTDLLGRILAQDFFPDSGQTTIVENSPGAGGNIGANRVARAQPDGYTLEIGAMSTHAMNGSLYQGLPFDPMNDFDPVAVLAQVINVIAISPSVPVDTFAELIDYIRANPGKLAYSSGGIGTHNHLTLALLADRADLDILHVPYKGGGPAVTALLQGEVQMFAGGASLLLSHAKAGTVKLIAVTEAEESELVPGVPSASEVVPGFEVTNWYGVFAPKGMDEARLDLINKEVNRILAQPEVAARLEERGMIAVPVGPSEVSDMLQNDHELWSSTIEDLGIPSN